MDWFGAPPQTRCQKVCCPW